MLGTRSLPWAAGRGSVCSGGLGSPLPSLVGLGARPRSRRRDTWEERGGHSCPCFKASLFSRRRQHRAPEGSVEIPVGPSGVGVALGAQAGSTIPMGASVETLSLSPHSAGAFRGAAGLTPVAVGDPEGMEPSPLGANCLQKSGLWMGADPHGLHFHPKLWVPQRIFTSPSALPRKSSQGGVGQLPTGGRGSQQPLLISWGSGRWRIRNWAPRGVGLAAWAPC